MAGLRWFLEVFWLHYSKGVLHRRLYVPLGSLRYLVLGRKLQTHEFYLQNHPIIFHCQNMIFSQHQVALNTQCNHEISVAQMLAMSLTWRKVDQGWVHQADLNKFMGETFQAAQLTHERFLTLQHSYEISLRYLPNWTSIKSTKFGPIFRIKWFTIEVIKKCPLQKGGPELIFFNGKNEKDLDVFWHRKLTLKVQFLHFFHLLTTLWKLGRYQKNILG